jgi:putative transposase
MSLLLAAKAASSQRADTQFNLQTQRQGHHPVILHSDRSSQFRSGDYQRYLAANGLVCSMSAVGHCGDNAACEGFFGMLKRERIHRVDYPKLDTAKADVFEYIERFHNPRMRRRVARQDRKLSALSQPSVVSG